MKTLKIYFAVLFAALSTVTAFAHSFEVDGIYYNNNWDGTVTVTYRGNSSYDYSNEYSGNVVIPSSLTYLGNTYAVTSIGADAFSDCYGLTSITIPNSVTSIGYMAFFWCRGLTSITIPNSVTSIGDRAFDECRGLTSVTIGNSVTSIDNSVFYNCDGLTSVIFNAENCNDLSWSVWPSDNLTSFTIGDKVQRIPANLCRGLSKLTSITIPNSVTSIGDFAFYDCYGLTSITIPNSVTSIGGSAFSGCSGLTSVIFNAENCNDLSEGWPSDNLTSFTIGDKVQRIPANLCYGLSKLTSITIPNSVTSIGDFAFGSCSGLTTIVVESGNTVYDSRNNCNAIVKSATNTLMFGCKNTVIPNSVTSIGTEAFSNCSGLTSITIPNSVTSIGNRAFINCSGLTSITIPNSVTYIGSEAFRDCTNLWYITVPNSVTYIGPEAFYNTHYYNYVCDRYYGVLYFGSVLYEYIGIMPDNTHIDVQEGTVSISPYAFDGCTQLTSITIPNSVTSIGNSAFYKCSGLTSITIPNSVTSIGEAAFSYCSGLTSITIPNSVTSIGNYVFRFCSGLTTIVVESGNTVYDSRNNCNAIVESATNTLMFGCKNTVIPNSVTSIGDSAFRALYGLTSIEIPNSVTSIGDYAFDSCTALKSIKIPNSVKSIGTWAFYHCTQLTSVTIPNSVTSIANDSFLLCNGLIKSAYPNHLINPFESGIAIAYPSDGIIDDNGVIYNKNKNTIYFAPMDIRSVSIPNSVTFIGDNAFYGCSNLIKSAYPNHLTNPFESGIAIAYPSDGIIDDNGVIYNKNKNTIYFAPMDIRSVSIPNSVTTIGNFAFQYCSNLEAIIIPKFVTSIGDDAFYSCSIANCLYLIEDSDLASKVKPCKSRYGAPIVCKQKGYENWKQFVNYTINGNNITLSGNGCTLTSATLNGVTYKATDNKINIYNYSAGAENPLMIKGIFFDCDFETELSLFDIEYEITKQTYNNVWLTAKIISNYTKYNAEYKFENENVTGGVNFYIPASILGLSADYFVTRISEINPEIGINDIYVKPNAISLKGTYKYLEDATYTAFRFQEDVIGSEAVFMGLAPNTTYTYDFSFETEEDGTFTVRKDYTTPSLTFEVLPAQVVNERKVLIRANTNGVDDALRFGFEWRRYDAPEEMPSTNSPCPVVEGVMYGALNNLSANTYYKFRPYYKSDDGNIFYGDWVAFYSGDAAAYFEPMVYTSGATEVRADVAQVKGVVVAGSDEILEQGFEYWDSANSGYKQTATSSGTLMNVELRNLAPETTYFYRAYAKTVKGNTYGTELSFTTEASAGIDEVYTEGENITILGYYNLQGLRFDEPQNGLNIILYSNGMTKKLYIRK